MSNTGKRLAKNTIYMYVRMFVMVIVSFYTSRVVLQQLGVSDFGIYSLAGSIVAVFNSLRTIFASSTQRFLNYEMGKNNKERLNLIFNHGLYINIFIAVVFVVLVEIVGICFFKYKINIDPDRLKAAYFVFQFSVLTAVVSIITTLFDAELIAHEKMNFYATMSIVETFLKLGIVYLLMISSYDKLIYYGFLHFMVSVVVLSCNALFCRINFEEVRVRKKWDKDLLKEMTKFAGWNFLGNTSYALTQNGINMVLNVFGGPLVNAARGLAFQLNSALNQFVANINVVVNPYSIKLYAEGNKEKMFKLTYLSSKILFCVQLCITIPFCYCSYLILDLWLGNVPAYSVVFLQLILIHSQIRSLHAPLDTIFKAYGDLKWYQIRESFILLIPLLAGYISLRAGMNVAIVFVWMILVECLNTIQILFLAKKQVKYPVVMYMRNVSLPCVMVVVAPLLFFVLFLYNSDIGICTRIVSSIFFSIFSLIVMFFCGMNQDEQKHLKQVLRK